MVVSDEERIFEFTSPESQFIAGAQYNWDTHTLTITFKNPDRSFVYTDIDEQLWLDFVDAHSKGQFFSARIRPFFSAVRKPS
jgi:hypothetical protein